MRFDTPDEMAEVLVSFLPRKCASILEPCVGAGALLSPLYRRGALLGVKTTILDIDSEALRITAAKFPDLSCDIYNQCFVEYVESHRQKTVVDCVLMNPPFDGRKQRWMDVTCEGRKIRCPIEAAFIICAMKSLKTGGRLLAVVPPSIIHGDHNAWLRKWLLNQGRFDRVHELPNFAFSNVESRMYLVVYDKGVGHEGPVRLLNHDLTKPHEFNASVHSKASGYRLDYRFYAAEQRLSVVFARKDLGWTKLGNLAEVIRGGIPTPTNQPAIHTTNYVDGFWIASGLGTSDKIVEPSAQIDDLLIKRVARDCSQSVGIIVGGDGFQCTDCVLLLRPRHSIAKLELLFALRTLFGCADIRTTIERGTGASYISSNALRNGKVPRRLSKVFKSHFDRYVGASRERDFTKMLKIEREVRLRLGL